MMKAIIVYIIAETLVTTRFENRAVLNDSEEVRIKPAIRTMEPTALRKYIRANGLGSRLRG
jgi:hypothetical protein